MAEHSDLEPITLAHWPSSLRCLTSSEDDLAVACSEHVHVLTPRRKASIRDPGPHPHWHINSIRVNRFSEQEWPILSLATLKHLSLGEEQSNSIVTAISWSYAGLGMHGRSVLAVLTSNLILALWETDGTIGKFSRTCIVNKYLPTETDDEQGVGSGRRSTRIRAFCWLPSLKFNSTPKYGLHHLVVANDNDTIFILSVMKSSSSKFGDWVIKLCIKCSLPDATPLAQHSLKMSSLQMKLFAESTISQISCARWEEQELETSAQLTLLKSSTMQVLKGQIKHTVKLSVSMSHSQEAENDLDQPILYRELKAQTLPSIRDTLEFPPLMVEVKGEEVQPDLIFQSALKPLLKSFDREYGLFGHHKVRFWGACRVLNTPRLAACVTLHPSDMIEHTQPSTERCVVVFIRTGKTASFTSLDGISDGDIHQKILKFVVEQVQTSNCINTELDKLILGALNSLAKGKLMSALSSQALGDASQLDIRNQVRTEDVVGVGYSANASFAVQYTDAKALSVSASQVMGERCEICSANIPFSDDTGAATCSSGHQFTRCNLSFLAVQQPGISKYCSGCGRQFLDVVKLGMQGGPSFTHALFDEFDVCPYCGAKFRG